MRIGIVTDVHDEVNHLAAALAVLRAEAVDAVVTLGDNTDLFGKWNAAAEVAALLREAGAVGVWGNHDHGLCRDASDANRGRFPAATREFFESLHPTLELGGCHFSHVEPFLNPNIPGDLWTFEGRPEDDDRRDRSFAAIPHRVACLGHFHRWLALTATGRVAWEGDAPLHFAPGERYLVVVAPLFRGEFAVLDTDRWVLEPRKLPPRPSGEPATQAAGQHS